MNSTTKKPTTAFWVIGVIALVWNLIGVMAYIAQAYITDEALAILPEAEQALYRDIPAWATAAFAIGVFAGALGCIVLLMKKKLATSIFTVSLLGILVQMYYNLFQSNAMDVYGPGGMVMPILILVIAIFLVWYSKDLGKRGVLS
ncbi:hypothetical protein GCM10011416_16120 [Polaribacter pacificus]|uniref:Sugar transporter n=1 Tax=Polaribacter pacificus TaxID=1775173 RepID=A0A917I0A2_9FLAO|nr:hypothetical protein [Polaribacter pacificus]GGG98681.1 hypothetical protein GCM10011416_16120 [Polaribacter pacificus]